MSVLQDLHGTGQAVSFGDERSDSVKPKAMPKPDSHANRTFVGRSGKLKAGRPMNLGGDALKAKGQGSAQVQKSRKRRK